MVIRLFNILGSVHGASASTSAGSHTYGGPETVSEGPGSADYGHQPAGTGEKGKRGTPMMVHKNTNYDEIFNVGVVCTGGDVVVDTHTHTGLYIFILTLNNNIIIIITGFDLRLSSIFKLYVFALLLWRIFNLKSKYKMSHKIKYYLCYIYIII